MSTWRAKVVAERAEAAPLPAPTLPGPRPSGVSKNTRRGGKSAQGKKPAAKAKGKGSASLRGKIRGLERTLKHQGEAMTPAARAAKQEEIASLVALFEDRKRRERERELAKKYHMVKFFERRKLQRRLERVAELAKKPGADEDELAARRKALLDDLAYVVNYPKDQPYVALFPTDGHSEESQAEVEKMRALIRTSALSGAPGSARHVSADGGTGSGGGGGGGGGGNDNNSDHGDGSEKNDDFFLQDG
jgi:hypothetical protein